jgi:hypothetical protein
VVGYLDTEIAAIKSVADKLDTALVLDGATYQFTINALENAPGGAGLDALVIADAVRDELAAELERIDVPVSSRLAAINYFPPDIPPITPQQPTGNSGSCGNNLGHVVPSNNFLVNQGSYWTTDFDLVDMDEQSMALEGCSFAGHARRDRAAGTPVAFSFRFRIDHVDKRVYVWLNEQDTENLSVGTRPTDAASTFYFDWEMTDSLGDVHRIQQGKIWIDRNQTRETN